LRAFESAARHCSFTKAAKELFVTQSAISRQIRSLEDYLDLELFTRHHKAIALTPEGQVYMRDLVAAFARLDLATRRISHSRRREALHVHAYATVAMRWLIPRMKTFQEAYPEIDVQLTASVQPVDFDRDEVHCAIRSGPPVWGENIHTDKLFESTIVPVCAPSYLNSPWPLRTPNDLNHVTLLHSLARNNDWAEWLAAVGAENVDPDRGMKFESSIMAYLAAEQGMGVVIAQTSLVKDDLLLGKLVMPFEMEVPSDRSYYLLLSPRFEGWSVLNQFRSWLLEGSTESLDPAKLSARPSDRGFRRSPK
jgi:LysR family glycine cleavage system transcriptional activator